MVGRNFSSMQNLALPTGSWRGLLLNIEMSAKKMCCFCFSSLLLQPHRSIFGSWTVLLDLIGESPCIGTTLAITIPVRWPSPSKSSLTSGWGGGWVRGRGCGLQRMKLKIRITYMQWSLLSAVSFFSCFEMFIAWQAG